MLKNFHLIGCFIIINILLSLPATAQYRVDFNQGYKGFEPNNLPGWTTMKGDGDVIFRQKYEDGSAVLNVDARKDKRNIWYAFMHQDVADVIDIRKLSLPDYELRMEARVKPSHGPRRVNMYLSTRGEGGYLREFDLEEANEWHTISMVTSGYNFDPEKPLMAQVSLMDWGVSDIFELHVDYIQVDLININDEQVQHGLPLEYRPKLEKASTYKEEVTARSKLIDRAFADEILKPWMVIEDNQPVSAIQVDQSKIILLHWNLEDFQGKIVNGAGQLELSTLAVFRRQNSPKDFGMVRFSEIRNTNTQWQNAELTYNYFIANQKLSERIVSQCIIDTEVDSVKGGKTIVTISQPVMQRLIDGKSEGIAIMPLGLISAAFYDETNAALAPVLRFNIKE